MTHRGAEFFMRAALEEAGKAAQKSEVPVGCVIVRNNDILARAHNLKEAKRSPLAHAEILCLEKAARKQRNSWRFEDCDLFVTLEPCPMCLGAILQARFRAVYYGAAEPKMGSLISRTNLPNHYAVFKKPKIHGGVLEDQCKIIVQNFFKKLRSEKRLVQHASS